MALPKLFQRIFWHNNTTPAINEDNLNAMSKAIDDIDNRVIALGDDVMTVVPQIAAYLEQAEDLVEAMELLSENPPYIGSNGNWYVWDTNTSSFVDSGVDASITVDIADITMLAPDATPYVTNTGTATDPVFHLFIPRGETGNGISTIAKTGTSGLVDTYTITMTNGTTSTFTVTNGSGDMNKSVYDSDNTVANKGGIKAFVNGEVEDVYEVMGQNGAKNLLPFPYRMTSGTGSGITRTINKDGSISLSGTNQTSSTIGYNIQVNCDATNFIDKAITISIENAPLNENAYCPFILRDGSGNNVERHDIDSEHPSYTFNVPSNVATYDFQIYVRAGKTINATLYPMIRLASDIDSTYQPYAETNQQLTAKTDGLRDNMMDNGAVNLLENSAVSYTDPSGEVTWTVNADKTVTAVVNQTITATRRLTNVFSVDRLNDLLDKFGTLRLTGSPSGKIDIYGKYSDNTYFADDGTGTIIDKTHGNVTQELRLQIEVGTTPQTFVIKPMLSAPSLNLSYDDYVPYAMSNRELTEDGTTKVIDNEMTSTVGTFSLNKLIKKNGMMTASFQLTLSSNIGGYNVMISFPSAYETPTAFTAVGYRYTNNTNELFAFTAIGTSIQPIIGLSSGDIVRGSVTWALK